MSQADVSSTVDAQFEEALYRHAKCALGRVWSELGEQGREQVVSLAVRDFCVSRMLETEKRHRQSGAKRVHYLSMEFLMGQSLGNNVLNAEIEPAVRRVLTKLGVDFDALARDEEDAALGNGGLGRLAACFLDSMATLGIAGYGHGINYEFGLFRQEISGDRQKERPDHWLCERSPWEIERRDEACVVPVYGRVVESIDRNGEYNPMWLDWSVLVGVPYDMPIVGYGGRTVNYLRLYSARASDEFDMAIFNEGDFHRAVDAKVHSETVSKVLYPSDAVAEGRELRLVQEYFLVACALRGIVRGLEAEGIDISQLPEKVAIQMNDTHPSLAVAELMRLLVDEYGAPWIAAWDLTRQTLAYTNHTLLPEALEKWPVSLLERVLPRHLQIIHEVNRRHLEEVIEVWPNDPVKLAQMSVIEEGDEKRVRMANLAIVGSHSINGVSAIHSDLVKSRLVPDFYAMFPERFNNKTNGVTPRRWMALANPEMTSLITSAIGDRWLHDLDELRGLETVCDDAGFRAEFAAAKTKNKQALAELIRRRTLQTVDPESLFDVHAKRIHEYKRQLLNILRIVNDFLRVTEDGWTPPAPRTYIFAGKAAPGYWAAKEIIRLVHRVAAMVHGDPRTRDVMQVVFLPDYRVSVAEQLIPATDLSEQISTAGMEASGTGNMKFAMNGALTIGTADGANIEMCEEIGDENMFIFGLSAQEIEQLRWTGEYRPREIYERSDTVRRVLDCLRSPVLSPDDPGLFTWIVDALLTHGDTYFVVADLESYLTAQDSAGAAYCDSDEWCRKAILNVARMGKFSSDRSIAEYAWEVWQAEASDKDVIWPSPRTVEA